MGIQPKHTHLQWRRLTGGRTDGSKDTLGRGCSKAWMLPPVTQRTPSGCGDPPHTPVEAAGGVRAHTHGCTHLVCKPQAGKVLCPVGLLLARTGANNDVLPSQPRAPGEAAHRERERGCYGNLRRMEPGTAVTLNPAPSISPGGRGANLGSAPAGTAWAPGLTSASLLSLLASGSHLLLL